MTARTGIVWLASYPKSGNTWARAIIDALYRESPAYSVATLVPALQPNVLLRGFGALGMDPSLLTRAEAEQLREALIADSPLPPEWGPDLRKTHEVFRTRPRSWGDRHPAPEPFPPGLTRAAVHLVRDPRDIAGSLAAYLNVGLDEAVELMRGPASWRANPPDGYGEQPWGSWSEHCESWLADDIPFPVHRVRYEDLLADPVGTLLPVCDAVGIATDRESLSMAVEATRIEKLRSTEQDEGFQGKLPVTKQFFRKGRSGSWRDELPEGLVAEIVREHGPMMTRLGYLP